MKGDGDRGNSWAQQHGLPLTKVGSVSAAAKCLVHQQLILSLQYVTIPRRAQPATSNFGKLTIVGPICPATYLLLPIVGMAFLAHRVSVRTTICKILEYLIHRHKILHNTASN